MEKESGRTPTSTRRDTPPFRPHWSSEAWGRGHFVREQDFRLRRVVGALARAGEGGILEGGEGRTAARPHPEETNPHGWLRCERGTVRAEGNPAASLPEHAPRHVPGGPSYSTRSLAASGNFCTRPSTHGLVALHCGAVLLTNHSKKVRILHFLQVKKIQLCRRTDF